MEEVILEVETITPLFIAGADQRNIENEGLRAPSLRGLLRWWFRAIMGGMVSIHELREMENNIFGFREKKSIVKILCTIHGQPSEINVPQNLRYLWFSVDMQKRKPQRKQCFPPKTKFRIILTSKDKSTLKMGLGCLWALIYLGGVGTRARRGAGSLKVNKVVNNNTPYEFILNGNSVNDAKKFMEENLRKIFLDFKDFADEKFEFQEKPNFAVLSHAKISLVNKPSADWKDVLEKISMTYQQLRKSKKVEHRSTLGLPIIQLPSMKNLRHASPCLFGVIDLNGVYTARIVKFYTSIHPSFSQRLEYLKQDLDEFDKLIFHRLGEITINIPQVVK